MNTQSNTPEINHVTEAVQRCLAAYHHVLESNPKPPGPNVYREDYNEYKIEQQAQRAFLREMPFLDSWEHTLCCLACLQHAMLLGIIDRVDAGRHIHLLQLAISAYRPKPEPRAVGRPKIIPTLPSTGNQAAPSQGVPSAANQPTQEDQVKLKEELSRLGISAAALNDPAVTPAVLQALHDLAKANGAIPAPKAPGSEPQTAAANPGATASGQKAAA